MKMNGVEIAEVSEKGTVGKSVEVFGDCCSRISSFCSLWDFVFSSNAFKRKSSVYLVPRFLPEKQFLRDAIDDAASTARSPEEFSKILDEKYHIIFKISRNRYSYLHPGRNKYITGKNLGTRYTEDFLLKVFEENTKSHKEQKEEILEQQTPNTSTDLPTVSFSNTSAIPAPFIF